MVRGYFYDMALKDQPYIPLYVQDLLTDERLIECSAEAHGVYFRLLCIMHKSEQYGTILLKQKDKQKCEQTFNFAVKLAKQLPFGLSVIQQGLKELIDEGVIHLSGDMIFQKRMVRDNEISAARSKAGKKGGDKTVNSKKHLLNNLPEQKDKQIPENEIEYENEVDIEYKNENKVKGEKPKKDAYGSFKNVKLTGNEYQALCDKHGETLIDLAIEHLSKYGEEKPGNFKKYKNHNLTLQRWVIDAVKEQQAKGDKPVYKSTNQISNRNNELTKFNNNLSATEGN